NPPSRSAAPSPSRSLSLRGRRGWGVAPFGASNPGAIAATGGCATASCATGGGGSGGAGGAAGRNVWAQPGHFTRLPARSGDTRNSLSQSGQRKRTWSVAVISHLLSGIDSTFAAAVAPPGEDGRDLLRVPLVRR